MNPAATSVLRFCSDAERQTPQDDTVEFTSGRHGETMAFDEALAQRIRDRFQEDGVVFVEKKVMGGLCFMVNGKMCVGVEKDRLMLRIDPEKYDAALARNGCVPMDFTGKPMRGFVFVNSRGTRSRDDFQSWLGLALEFNPRAKASRRTSRAQRRRSVKSAAPRSTRGRRKQ